MANKASNTGRKQGKLRNPKIAEAGKATQFKPGDPRINRKGRPRSFDKLRELFQDIAAEQITVKGKKLTRAQAIGIAMSMDKKLMRDFLEFAYGKVPAQLDVKNDGAITLNIVYKDKPSGNGS